MQPLEQFLDQFAPAWRSYEAVGQRPSSLSAAFLWDPAHGKDQYQLQHLLETPATASYWHFHQIEQICTVDYAPLAITMHAQPDGDQ